jgi:coronin-7
MDKVILVAFNPVAKDVLLTVSSDRNNTGIRIWDLNTKEEKLHFEHGDVVFDAAWKLDGKQFATSSKSKKIKIFDAQEFKLVAEGPSHNSIRPAKLVWLGETGMIASVGFGLGSAREILVYKVEDLGKGPCFKKNIDISPSVMSAYFDPDCGVLYVAGRVSITVAKSIQKRPAWLIFVTLNRAIESFTPLSWKKVRLLLLQSTNLALYSKA